MSRHTASDWSAKHDKLTQLVRAHSLAITAANLLLDVRKELRYHAKYSSNGLDWSGGCGAAHDSLELYKNVKKLADRLSRAINKT